MQSLGLDNTSEFGPVGLAAMLRILTEGVAGKPHPSRSIWIFLSSFPALLIASYLQVTCKFLRGIYKKVLRVDDKHYSSAVKRSNLCLEIVWIFRLIRISNISDSALPCCMDIPMFGEHLGFGKRTGKRTESRPFCCRHFHWGHGEDERSKEGQPWWTLAHILMTIFVEAFRDHVHVSGHKGQCTNLKTGLPIPEAVLFSRGSAPL